MPYKVHTAPPAESRLSAACALTHVRWEGANALVETEGELSSPCFPLCLGREEHKKKKT